MLYRVRNKIKKAIFNIACRDILRTDPIGSNNGPVLLSEVGNDDILMYLVAIKSFYSQIGEGKIVLMLDKDCPEKNLKIFKEHVRPWKILWVEDIISDKCPIGGTWERILSIGKLIENDYVIQIDSDTVCKKPVPEIKKCIETNASFMIGTEKNQRVEPAIKAVERARNNPNPHVQNLGEKMLEKLDGFENLRYARGQSSFAGFKKKSFTVEELEQFSQKMMDLLGAKKWSEWGSESFTSNFFVSNDENSVILPWPEYARYNPMVNVKFDHSKFIHYEGTYRFKRGAYIRDGKRVIHKLLKSGS